MIVGVVAALRMAALSCAVARLLWERRRKLSQGVVDNDNQHYRDLFDIAHNVPEPGIIGMDNGTRQLATPTTSLEPLGLNWPDNKSALHALMFCVGCLLR